MKIHGILLLSVSIGLLSACAGSPSYRLADPGVPAYNQSYVVHGKRYHVLETGDGYVRRGIASWYGPKFHGRPTSTGKRYNMYALTAASRDLPLPSRVKVTNLQNGREVVVMVNDRGPFVRNRIIDLSYAAAKQLGMIQKGTALVEVRVIETGERARAQINGSKPEPNPRYFLQAGAFAILANAERLKQQLLKQTRAPVEIVTAAANTGSKLYRVRLGPFSDRGKMDAAAEHLRTGGIDGLRVISD